MRRAWTLAVVVLLVQGALLAREEFPQSWPLGCRECLVAPAAARLYSLEPSRAEGAAGFQGWKVLGQVSLTSSQARELTSALLEGVDQRRDPATSDCFAPRHGLRVGDLDVVICFECLRLRCYRGGHLLGELLMTDHAASPFRATVARSGLPWDGWILGDDGRWRSSLASLPALTGFDGSPFGEALRLRRPAARREPLEVKPLGLAILSSEEGQIRQVPVGHQELKGWSDLMNPLRTYFPGLQVSLDENSGRLWLSGPNDVLSQAEKFLLDTSRPAEPETVVLTTVLKAPEADRYRRSWEMDYAVSLSSQPFAAAAAPIRQLWTGVAELRGVPTRFSILLLGDSTHSLLIQVQQPETDTESDVLSEIVSGLDWSPGSE